MERWVLTDKYADLLRHACRVLHNVPAQVVSSVSVTFTLSSPEEVLAVAKLSEHLAEEYDLQAQVEHDGRGLTAYFRRRDRTGEI